MNNEKNYKKGYRNELTKILHMVGAIPYNALPLMPGSPLMNIRMFRKMKEEGVVELVNKNGRRIVMFRNYESRNHEFIDSMPTGYYEYYTEISEYNRDKIKSGSQFDAERVARCGEIAVMVHTAGVRIYIEECPMLKWNVKINPQYSYYYASREIKKYHGYKDIVKYEAGVKEVSGSRLIGMLISAGGDYGVYNISENLIEWSRGGELKMATHLTNIVQEKIPSRNAVRIDAIVLMKNLSLVERIINNENINRTTNLISIDNVYQRMYALPVDKIGIEMMKILTVEQWQNKIISTFVSENEYKNGREVSVACDGYDGEIYTLVYCVPDITKLKLFVRRAQSEQAKEYFQIYCFDWQKEALEPITRNIATLNVVPFEKYVTNYFKEVIYGVPIINGRDESIE